MRTRREGIALGAFCAGFALAAAAAGDFGGRAILSWQSYDAEDLETEGLHQLYDLRFERDLTDTLRMRLTFRGEDDDSGSSFANDERSTAFRETQPGARLTYRSGALQILGDWSSIRTTTSGEDASFESERTQDRARAQLTWRRENLPAFSAEAERRDLEDPLAELDLTETRGSARLDYAWQGFHAGVTHLARDLEDLGAGFTRANRDLQGSLAYSGSWWSDRLAVQLDSFTTEGRIEERALGGAARVPNPVTIAATWQGLDATPGDDRDQPLLENPRLRDGDLSAAAGAPLGPDAPVDLNLAVDLGRFALVDELRIVARDPAGIPVATGGAISWDLYVSDDFVLWRRVTTGVASRFDSSQGFWSVTFPQATLRYFKVVTFFVNSVPTEVTELEAFFTTELAPGDEVVTDTSYRSGNLGVNFRPHSSLTLGWWGAQNDSTLSSAERGETSTNNRDQRASILWAPRPWGSLELQRQLRRAETSIDAGVYIQQYDTWTGYARWNPGRKVSSTLEYSVSEDEIDGRRIDQERLLVHAFARFWEALDLTIDAGEVRQERVSEGWSVSSPTFSGSLRAQLTRSLQWTVTASLQENRFSGALPAGLEPRESDRRWWTEFYWRPSGRLGLGARFGEASDGERSGVLQSYQLQWQPFPGGALSLASTFDQELDPVNDREARRLILSPSWRINRSLTLNLSYLDLATRQRDVEQRTRSLFAALSLTF